MSKQEELKPCPFCGGEAFCTEVTRYAADGTPIDGYYHCNCVRCGAGARGLVGRQAVADAVDDAISAWNRRAEPALAELRTKVEAMRREPITNPSIYLGVTENRFLECVNRSMDYVLAEIDRMAAKGDSK